jgi:predicted NBD/HSP70 family sugar kinase
MFLTVDIGGTNTRIALSLDGKKILYKEKYPTPLNYDEGLNLLVEKIETISGNRIPKSIVVGIPGNADKIKGKITKTVNLSEWTGHSFGHELEHILKTHIILENDATLAALAESHYKPFRKYDVLAYITLSTGVGGARVVKQQVDYTAQNFEPGHQILEPNGRFWPSCGQRGCFESLASGKAFELTYGVKAENCEDIKIWEEHARIVSQGLVNVITLWTPDILVLGGSLTKAGNKFLDPLIHFTANDLKIYKPPKIVLSNLGDDNVLQGGMYLLHHRSKQ